MGDRETEAETMDRKQIAQTLDRAAQRAQDAGATAKQTWFLAGLILTAPENADPGHLEWEMQGYRTGARLTRGEASALIEGYLAAQKRAATLAA